MALFALQTNRKGDQLSLSQLRYAWRSPCREIILPCIHKLCPQGYHYTAHWEVTATCHLFSLDWRDSLILLYCAVHYDGCSFPELLHHFGSDGKYVHFPRCSRETILDVSFNSPSFNTHIIPLCFLRVLISGFSQNFCCCCCCCSYFSKNHLSFFNRQEGEEVCQSAFLRCDKIAEVNNSKERTFILAHSCRGPWAEHRYGQHTVGQKLIPLWQP